VEFANEASTVAPQCWGVVLGRPWARWALRACGRSLRVSHFWHKASCWWVRHG